MALIAAVPAMMVMDRATTITDMAITIMAAMAMETATGGMSLPNSHPQDVT
jgi:hypothetical protein